MCRILFIIVIVFQLTVVHSQEYRDYNWQLGQRTYNDTMPYSLVFDFKDSQFDVDLIFRQATMYLTNASISDTSGELLLYTNGCAVFSSDHEVLLNGDELNPGIAFETQCGDEYNGYAVAEGAQFIHFGDSLIILMHLADQYLSNPTRVFVNRVFATTFLNHKEELVVLRKNELILTDTIARGIECIRNDGGWWCIAQNEHKPLYYIIDVQTDLEFEFRIQEIGNNSLGLGGGQTVFSPDGTQYARYSPSDQLFLFDFDRETATLADFKYIHVSDSGFVGGIAFSPSSQYLYVSSQFDLYQVDTWAEDIQESVTHIAHFDGYFSPFPATFYLMQLGPDCRIYMIPPNGIDVMHVIHDPDMPGTACNFEQHGIQLPVPNSISLPNFPNYRLGIGPPCDPNITGLAEILPEPVPVRIGPNPASDALNIWSDVGNATFLLFDVQGHNVLAAELSDNNYSHSIDLDLVSGLYVYTLLSVDGTRYSGKLLVQNN